MSLKRGTVELEEHNETWKEEYKKEERILKEKLKDYIIEINHVGSTSIDTLMAKPIIDISIVIKSLEDINKIEKILGDEYSNRGPQGVDDRMFFAKGPEDARTHYLHFTEPNSETYYAQVYFKRFLNEHPDYIKKYCDLKQELAKKYPDDRKSYTAGKNEFIKNVIELAKGEYND